MKMTLLLPILVLLSASPLSAGTLTLYTIRSPKGIDWSSPKRLAKTIVNNYLGIKRDRIGHVQVELSCQNEKRILSGMNVKSFFDKNPLETLNLGLGFLFENFPGKLETEKESASTLKDKAKQGLLTHITFEINENSCFRLKNFFEDYKEAGHFKNYGLPNRPRFGEGGGCSAFGIAFMDLAGLLEQKYYDSWMLEKRAPMNLIGGDLTGERVSLVKLLTLKSSQDHWANENQAHHVIQFWSPDHMYNWIKGKLQQPDSDMAIVEKYGVKGLYINKESVPTPTDPIWQF
ncbi:MAG: hypothetical protein ACOYL6_18100 [Bacteriovoracaceae bacterium]